MSIKKIPTSPQGLQVETIKASVRLGASMLDAEEALHLQLLRLKSLAQKDFDIAKPCAGSFDQSCKKRTDYDESAKNYFQNR